MECPSCKVHIDAPHCQELENNLMVPRELYNNIEKKALDRAELEGLKNDERFVKEPFNHNMKKFALAVLSFYECFECKSPYYGGMVDCQQNDQQQQNFKPEDLICGACAAKKMGAGLSDCPKHGKDWIEFKCRYCC